MELEAPVNGEDEGRVEGECMTERARAEDEAGGGRVGLRVGRGVGMRRMTSRSSITSWRLRQAAFQCSPEACGAALSLSLSCVEPRFGRTRCLTLQSGDRLKCEKWKTNETTETTCMPAVCVGAVCQGACVPAYECVREGQRERRVFVFHFSCLLTLQNM